MVSQQATRESDRCSHSPPLSSWAEQSELRRWVGPGLAVWPGPLHAEPPFRPHQLQTFVIQTGHFLRPGNLVFRPLPCFAVDHEKTSIFPSGDACLPSPSPPNDRFIAATARAVLAAACIPSSHLWNSAIGPTRAAGNERPGRLLFSWAHLHLRTTNHHSIPLTSITTKLSTASRSTYSAVTIFPIVPRPASQLPDTPPLSQPWHTVARENPMAGQATMATQCRTSTPRTQCVPSSAAALKLDRTFRG